MNKLFKYVLTFLILAFASSASALNLNFDKAKANKINSRPGGLTSPATFKKISQAHKYLADSKYDKALGRLKPLLSKTKKKFELAQVYQTMGYIYAGKGDEKTALSYFKKSLDTNAFALGPTRTSTYMVAQIQVGNKQYKTALKTLEGWFQITKKPSAQSYVLLATIMVETGKKDLALKYVNKALKLTDNPKESWLQFAAGLNMEKGDFPKAAFALEKLVTINPGKGSYWKMLAGCYLSMDQNKKALNSMAVAYEMGQLKSEQDLLNLASLYAGEGIPLTAGQIVEKAFKEGKMKKSKKTLQFLAQSFVDSEDKQKAIAALKEASSKTEDGKLALLQGQLHMEKGQWASANKAFSQALSKGKLSNEGQVYMVRGMARINLDEFDKARADFEKLGEFEKYTTQSTTWLNYLKFKEDAFKILKPKQYAAREAAKEKAKKETEGESKAVQ